MRRGAGQPRSVAAVLRELDRNAAGRDELAARRGELLRALAQLDDGLVDRIAAIADPLEQAVAATRALDVEDALLAVRNGAIRELVRPPDQGGQGVSPAAVGRRLDRSRQDISSLLRRPPAAVPASAADPVVARIRRAAAPWVRAEAAALALEAHAHRNPKLAALQRQAARRAVFDHGVPQAEVARRLGKDPTWIGVLVGTKGRSGRHRQAKPHTANRSSS
jgi:hypothetical protein